MNQSKYVFVFAALAGLSSLIAQAQAVARLDCQVEGSNEKVLIDLSGDGGAVGGKAKLVMQSPGATPILAIGTFQYVFDAHPSRMPKTQLSIAVTGQNLTGHALLTSFDTLDEGYSGALELTDADGQAKTLELSCAKDAVPLPPKPPVHCGRCAF